MKIAWAAALALLCLVARPGAGQPLMKILIAPGPMSEAVNKGDVRVAISVPDFEAAAGTPLFTLTAFPELSVSDAAGPVTVAPATGGARRWTATRAVSGDLVIRYRVPVQNTATNGGIPPLGPRIDGNAFSANGQTFLAIPETSAPYRIRIDWDLSGMGPEASAVSTFGDGAAELPAGPVSRLRLAAFMAGRLYREPSVVAATGFSSVWAGDPGFDLRPPMQWASRLHSWMTTFFRTTDDPPYRVFLRYNPANAGGGVAYPNSFVVTYGAGVTAETMKHILPHEMTHTWTANNLGKWYDEGNAVYYQALLPWRAGMITTDAYLDDINKTAARYYTNAELDAPEDKVIPNFWSDIWLNMLSYDRGALYFAVLNGKIRRASGGKRSVDDLVRELVHKARAGDTITESTWVDLLRRELGDDGVAVHRTMMQGGIVRPQSDDYGPCFKSVTRQIRRFELGFTPRSMPDGRKQVDHLVDGSEAAKAGLRNGDVVSYPPITTDGLRRDPQANLAVQVTRNDTTFQLTYLPRGVALEVPQWERVAAVPESDCR
jgi:predicted metalloprotease with PDZ domain